MASSYQKFDEKSKQQLEEKGKTPSSSTSCASSSSTASSLSTLSSLDEANDKAIAKVVAAEADARALDRQKCEEEKQETSVTSEKSFFRFTSVTKLFNGAPISNSLAFTGFTNIPPELRSLILTLVDGDMGETKSYSPNASEPFTFFNQIDLPVTALLTHVVHGEMKEVKALLDKDPSLLLYKGRVTDYSGRIIEGTAYQMAWGAGDLDLYTEKGIKIQDGMVQMMEEYFKKLTDGDKIKAQQYQQQFPENYAEIEANKIEADKKALHALVGEIHIASDQTCKVTNEIEDKIRTLIRTKKSDSTDVLTEAQKLEEAKREELKGIVQSLHQAKSAEQFDAAFEKLENYLKQHNDVDESFDFKVMKALYQFRNYLEPKGILTVGKHFNLNLLTEAAILYDTNYRNFGNDSRTPKNLLCWQKVFGYVQRFVPACDAQLIAQRLEYISEGQKSLRSLEQCLFGWLFPFSLDFSASSGELGYNWAAGITGGLFWPGSSSTEWGIMASYGRGVACFQILCQKQHYNIEELKKNLSKQDESKIPALAI